MKPKPLSITLHGMEFSIPKVGAGTGKRYEILHTVSGRSLRIQFKKRCEAVAWLRANIERVTSQVEAALRQLSKRGL